MRQIFAALMMGITCATVGRSENIVVELRDGVAMEFVWIEPGTLDLIYAILKPLY